MSVDGSGVTLYSAHSNRRHQRREMNNMDGSQSQWRPPRACEVYWSEFKHCKSLLNRFHQYYTHGTAPDCQQWKEDFNSCKEWEKNQSAHFRESLQQSERKRVAEQEKFSPVWELRQTPPADWHLPLNQGKPQDS